MEFGTKYTDIRLKESVLEKQTSNQIKIII